MPLTRESSEPRLSQQADAFRGLDHLVKGGVQEIERSVEGPLLEVTSPYQQRQALGRLPCVLIELMWARERINPGRCFSERCDAGVVLKRRGVQWNGHGSVF